MSMMSDQPETRVTSTEVRGRAEDTFPEPQYRPAQYPSEAHRAEQKVRETKPSLATSEFWMTLGGIAALIVVYLMADNESLDLFRTAMLATVAGAAYILSRGFAKSGSRTERWYDTSTRYRDDTQWGDADRWRENR